MSVSSWRPVLGWPGYYVSVDGRVASTRQGPWRILIQNTNRLGYRMVNLRRNGHYKTRSVHVLVAEAFIGPRPPGLHTRHLDGDKANNVLSNLAFGTPSENAHDQVAHGRHYQANKTHCPSGHEYTPDNTRLDGGSRYCVTCKRARTLAGYHRRKRAAA